MKALTFEDKEAMEDERDVTTDSSDDTEARFDSDDSDEFDPGEEEEDVMADHFMDLD